MMVADEYDCGSLEKVSDSSNVLDKSSLLLQRTEETTLQQALPTLPDTPVPVPATISSTLPHEIVERILLLLDAESILTCKLVNREFNETIQSSTALQYYLSCKAAGVIDNPKSPLSYAERLEALRKRENAWRTLNPLFETTIKVNHQTPLDPGYIVTEGGFFLEDNNRRGLYYCLLPSSPQDNLQWSRISGHGPREEWPGVLVSACIAIHEHDLIVNAICSEVGNQADTQQFSLDLVLLKFSTGLYHPLACHSRIHIQRLPSSRVWVFQIVIGDNLAVVIHNTNGMGHDKLIIFDWKTGEKRLYHETTGNGYTDFGWVSPELLLVPNLKLSHFEVWHVPPSHAGAEPPVQILSLKIPTVSENYFLSGLTCNGETTPFVFPMPYAPPQPFFPSIEDSIITATLHISSYSVHLDRTSYMSIMHRRALLDMIKRLTSSSYLEQQINLPNWLTNEITLRKIVDQEDGPVRLDAQSKLDSMIPHPRSSSRTSGFPTSSTPSHPASSSISSEQSTTTYTAQRDFLQVPWADWGPPISRWFQLNGSEARWIMSTAIQRYAFSRPNPLDNNKLMVSVADFNPYSFKRSMEMMARIQDKENNRSINVEELKGEKLDHGGVFAEELYMGLKCAVYSTPLEYDVDGLLMDEERLVGVKYRDRRLESIKVSYFG